MYFTTVILMLCFVSCVNGNTLTAIYTLETMPCNLPGMIKKSCAAEIPRARSHIHCVTLCQRKSYCVGSSIDTQGRCFHHVYCPHFIKCLADDRADHRYVSRRCVNGDWNAYDQRCKCYRATSGPRCTVLPTGCRDLILAGHQSGYHRIVIDPDRDGINMFPVVCHIVLPDFEEVLVLSSTGTMDFNRTWEDYTLGFYEEYISMWAGLEVWKHFSDEGYTDLLLNVELVEPYDSEQFFKHHQDFRLVYDNGAYKITLGSEARSDPHSCFGSLENTPFSTWDHDRDGVSATNCASRTGSGWWYSGCNVPCNLLGYKDDGSSNRPPEQLMSVKGVPVTYVKTVLLYIRK